MPDLDPAPVAIQVVNGQIDTFCVPPMDFRKDPLHRFNGRYYHQRVVEKLKAELEDLKPTAPVDKPSQ